MSNKHKQNNKGKINKEHLFSNECNYLNVNIITFMTNKLFNRIATTRVYKNN